MQDNGLLTKLLLDAGPEANYLLRGAGRQEAAGVPRDHLCCIATF